MTAIHRILNVLHMQVLMEILLILIWQATVTAMRGLSEVKRTADKQQFMPQRYNPYRGSVHLLREEPPLRGRENLVQKNLVQELWMEQRVNHFDKANNETWLMRYFRNDHYFQPHSPIFIFVGGEWEITPAYLLTGHMHDIAKQHNGMLYYVEHRFYGQSWPMSDAAVDNLKTLSARQALTDLAHFIRQLKYTDHELADSKVLLTGASYSGSLVAWFAKLYPDLVNAGWASSAPLVARVDFYEYMQQVGKVIQHRGGQECSERLDSGLAAMANILESTNATQLLESLRVCNTFEITNVLDRAAIFNGIGNYFAAYAQLYDDQIPNICAKLTTASENNNDFTSFILFIKRLFWPSALKRTQTPDWCIDLSYEGMKSIFTDVTERLSGTRQWFYQSCYEFGWFATTASNRSSSSTHFNHRRHIRQAALSRRHEQPFPWAYSFGRQVSLNYFQQLCRDVFDPHTNAASSRNDIFASVQHTNSHFGGLTAATTLQQRIIFTHGQLDPWRAVGLQQGKNVINIADYSHTADLDSINFDDSVEMNVAKLKVAAFLRRALRKTTIESTES